MSPRSEEFMAMARQSLEAANVTLEAGFPPTAVSAGYYAMFYAARAALSEEDLYAKTHSGTWNLFRQTFVADGRFDADLLTKAERSQDTRIGADYTAEQIDRETAAALLEVAERFLAAVDELYPH